MTTTSYRLIKPLGQGSYGKVDLALSSEGKRVAIKQSHRRSKSLKHEKSILFFIGERDIAGIPRLCDAIPSPSHWEGCRKMAIVMEYIEGQSMDDLIEAHMLSLSTVIDYIDGLFTILACLHFHQIVHRDLHDRNILIDGGGHVYLIDFGQARMGGNQTHKMMFRDEVIDMICVVESWVSSIPESDDQKRLLSWLDDAWRGVARRSLPVNSATSFLAIWRNSIGTFMPLFISTSQSPREIA